MHSVAWYNHPTPVKLTIEIFIDRISVQFHEILSKSDAIETSQYQLPGLTAAEFKKNVPEWYPKIYRAIAAITYGSGLDPEDLTQETFMKAYKRLDSYKSNSSAYTWLYQIAKNTCFDALRKVKVRRKAQSWFSVFSGEDNSSFEPPSEQGLDENMDQDERISLTRKAIAMLPDEQRSLIVFKDFEELSYEKMAEIFKVPQGTIKSRLFNARKQLKQNLEKLGYRHENF